MPRHQLQTVRDIDDAETSFVDGLDQCIHVPFTSLG
jgi:hypothetical protein